MATFALLCFVQLAHADGSGLAEYEVSQQGVYDAYVNPAHTTVIYLDAPIKLALNSDKDTFTAEVLQGHGTEIHERAIAIKPAKGTAEGTRGNLTIVTEAYKVTIRLVVVPVETAHLQVALSSARAEPVADDEVARSLLRRSQITELQLAAHQQGVFVSATKAQWIGDQLYLFFAVENHSDRPYVLANVHLRDGHSDRVSGVYVMPPAEGDALALSVIPPGKRHTGIIRVRAARTPSVGVPLTLTVSESRGRRPVSVRRIRW
ncbi:DUF2381 family protein [Haliangium sp.]|uniref:DUF2381 family protein n=1 Tax=Haliangium sp. TaxID=2663208 RepID=UPI003D0C0192